MSTPFKMKYQGSPLSMFGGAKSSPARSFWGKIRNLFSKGNTGGDDLGEAEDSMVEDVEGGGEGTVPQHGPESHGRGGGGGGGPLGGGFLSGMMGGAMGRMNSGGGNRGMSRWFQGGRG